MCWLGFHRWGQWITPAEFVCENTGGHHVVEESE